MAYLPPHLRNKAQTNSSNPAVRVPANTFSAQEIDNHYHPGEPAANGRTLHDSAATPGQLAYVILFPKSNPRWDTERIIYVKSNLELLASDSVKQKSSCTEGGAQQTNVDTAPAAGESNEPKNPAQSRSAAAPVSEPPSRPIAVFSQDSYVTRRAGYTFSGYFRISHLTFLEPNSDELVRMLEQKWTWINKKGRTYHPARTEEEWARSLSMPWAVVKFAADKAADDELGTPPIERLLTDAGAGGEEKGVNEMLKELRLRDSEVDEMAGRIRTV